jgi:hypothetical protein
VDFGHYEFELLTRINELAKLVGVEEYPTLSGYSNQSSTNETFGIVPVPGTIQDLPAEINLQHSALKDLSESMRHLCIRQKSLVPYLPVLTSQEEKQFSKYVTSVFFLKSKDIILKPSIGVLGITRMIFL